MNLESFLRQKRIWKTPIWISLSYF